MSICLQVLTIYRSLYARNILITRKSNIMERIAKELKVDSVSLEYDLGLVMVVGEGMKRTVGILSRITKALSENSINIVMETRVHQK